MINTILPGSPKTTVAHRLGDPRVCVSRRDVVGVADSLSAEDEGVICLRSESSFSHISHRRKQWELAESHSRRQTTIRRRLAHSVDQNQRIYLPPEIHVWTEMQMFSGLTIERQTPDWRLRERYERESMCYLYSSARNMLMCGQQNTNV